MDHGLLEVDWARFREVIRDGWESIGQEYVHCWVNWVCHTGSKLFAKRRDGIQSPDVETIRIIFFVEQFVVSFKSEIHTLGGTLGTGWRVKRWH